jgi:hypothetical protein
MPPLPPTPSNVIKVTLDQGVDITQPINAGIFFAYTGGHPSPGDCATIAGLIGGAWATNLASLMSTGGGVQKVTVRDLAVANGNIGEDDTAHAGTRVGLIPTEGTCMIINHKVGRHYRGGKPRSYMPWGVAADLADQKQWSSAFRNAVNTGWANFMAACAGLTGGTTVVAGPVNVSYFSGHTPNPSSSPWSKKNIPLLRGVPVVDAILSSSARTNIGTQRRRNR